MGKIQSHGVLWNAGRLIPTEIHAFIERRRLLSIEGIITEASIKVK
jgi:hypothetical protein